ncbi:MAG: serine/threonine protein kinase [Chloroflexi bacterium]|nr:serine/threonine protein kinase [Chloroflexota bacterium]
MDNPQVIGERYTLERLIGQGGIGQVYYGHDTQTNDPVAIKALKPHTVEDNPRLLERFRREGEALKELDHPHIVKMLALVEEAGRHYIVMEYVSGGSLYDLLKQHGKLPVERVLAIALDLCDALTRAHRLQIVHRDIKPANVLLLPDGTPRLTDFGAARMQRLNTLTSEGGIVGTVSYLSPEACQGQHVDGRTDIWSFGVMLFEMMTGQRPFDRSTAMATVIAIIKDPLPDLVSVLPDAPPKLVNLIYQMLEKEPDRRIASMRLVGAELEATIQPSGSGAHETLDLIFRMLEKGDNSRMATSGRQLVDTKLGTPITERTADVVGASEKPASSASSAGSTTSQPISVGQFEKQAPAQPPELKPVTNPQPLQVHSQAPAPEVSAAARMISPTLLLAGGAVVVILILLVLILTA